MKSRTTPNANIDKTKNGYLLKIPEGDSSSYRFAQIDDYFGLSRRNFPHHSLTLSLRAKTSSISLPGTWGFGLWNDPFGMSLGFGGRKWRLPTLPNAAWFFGASRLYGVWGARTGCLPPQPPPHAMLVSLDR